MAGHCHRGCVARPLTLPALLAVSPSCSPSLLRRSGIYRRCCAWPVPHFHVLHEPGPCPLYWQRRKAQLQPLRRDSGHGASRPAAISAPAPSHPLSTGPGVPWPPRGARAGCLGLGVSPATARCRRCAAAGCAACPHAQQASEAGAVAARFWFWSGPQCHK